LQDSNGVLWLACQDESSAKKVAGVNVIGLEQYSFLQHFNRLGMFIGMLVGLS
jgi:hypothetical protein